MDKKIFKLALPNIITNITIPLLGMIDIAIAGRLGSSLFIGAIALGSNIFNMIYWNFGFIRVSSSGFTAQALGARNLPETMNVLLRSLIVGLGIGFLILLLQYPIGKFALNFIHTGAESKHYVEVYFRILVWGAPAVLSMYALKGWYIGMQNARIPMIISIFNNVMNIILSIFFVFGMKMKIEGIALGTMLSNYLSLALSTYFWFRYYSKLRKYVRKETIWEPTAVKAFFKVNGDVFIRTFLLALVTTWFTFASSGMGDEILAVNALLMQFFMLFSYFMDGFAYAGEALTGKYIGARNKPLLTTMLRRLFFWGLSLSIVSGIIYANFPNQILHILTNDNALVEETKKYVFWTILIPITGFAAFLWDGIFIGATASKEMRNTMIYASAVFFATYYLLQPIMGNNGLWMAFILYLVIRSGVQTILAKRLIGKMKFAY